MAWAEVVQEELGKGAAFEKQEEEKGCTVVGGSGRVGGSGCVRVGGPGEARTRGWTFKTSSLPLMTGIRSVWEG